MDDYISKIELDVNAENNHKLIRAKQGDIVLRKVEITLLSDGVAFAPDGVAKVQFRVEKPDYTAVILESTDSTAPISGGSGVYVVTLSDQCLAAAGRAKCDLALLDSSGSVLSSANFFMDVVPMPNIGNIITSKTEYQALLDAIAAAENYADILAFRSNAGNIEYTTDNTNWTILCSLSSVVEGITDEEIDALFE